MPRVLITGSAGFIGRHLCRKFESDGWDVWPCDINTGYDDALDRFREDQPDRFFDLAIHCAAIVGGRSNIDGNPLSVATNLALDSWFFHWLIRSGTPRAVYFSSSAAYPTYLQSTSDRPEHYKRLREDHINLEGTLDIPDQTYGLVKLTGEILARQAIAEGCDVKVLRPFSGYGEDQSLDYPFPSFIDRALTKQNPFLIWGNGQQVRDWVHVDDVVGATIAALDQDIKFPVNVCSGDGTTFDHLAGLICKTANHWPKFEHILDAPSGVSYRVGDPTRLETFYKPKITLEQGIHRALKVAAAA